MMHKLTITSSDYGEGLFPTYENIAKRTGYPVTDQTQYDCCKLDVAANIQDEWIRFYHDRTKAAHPDLSEYDINQDIMSLLLCYGAKVNPQLSDDEVLIYPGFLSEAA